MLQQHKVEALETEIRDKKQALEKVEQDVTAQNKLLREKINQERETKLVLERLSQEQESLRASLVDMSVDKRQLKADIHEAQIKLDHDAHEKRVSELLSDQQGFNDALEARFNKMLDDLNGGLEIPGESKTFGDFIKMFDQPGQKASPHFSETEYLFTSAKKEYEEAMRNIVEASIKKQEITGPMKRKRTYILDRFLLDKRIERYWATT